MCYAQSKYYRLLCACHFNGRGESRWLMIFICGVHSGPYDNWGNIFFIDECHQLGSIDRIFNFRSWNLYFVFKFRRKKAYRTASVYFIHFIFSNCRRRRWALLNTGDWIVFPLCERRSLSYNKMFTNIFYGWKIFLRHIFHRAREIVEACLSI